MPPLSSGRATVVGYWRVPSMDQTRFSVEVSPGGTHIIFTLNIPRQFADLNSCVFLEVDEVADRDASAIASGFRQIQYQIICLFADLANIHPAGQVDALPFPCERNQMLICLLFQGDKLLTNQLQADCDYNYQYLSIVRVIFQGSEMLCHGTTHGRHQVIHAPNFQQNIKQDQQQPQVPYAL
jgi:hypothetical protein